MLSKRLYDNKKNDFLVSLKRLSQGQPGPYNKEFQDSLGYSTGLLKGRVKKLYNECSASNKLVCEMKLLEETL